MYYVYVLESKSDNGYYIGYTQGLEQRVTDHKMGRGRYTANRGPWKLIYKEEYQSKKEAIIRERQLKRWKSRKMIEQLASKNIVER